MIDKTQVTISVADPKERAFKKAGWRFWLRTLPLVGSWFGSFVSVTPDTSSKDEAVAVSEEEEGR